MSARSAQLIADCVVAFATISAPACGGPGRIEPGRTVLAWMNCVECLDGELDRVVALGDAAVPYLAQLAIQGAPASYLDTVRLEEDINYRRLVLAGVDTSLVRNVRDTYAENTSARFRIRSALALRRIGGPQARQALDSALSQRLRPDVRTVLTALRDSTPP
jgi:hypothetical protein